MWLLPVDGANKQLQPVLVETQLGKERDFEKGSSKMNALLLLYVD